MSATDEPGVLTPSINMYGGQAPIDRWGDIALRPLDGYRAELLESPTENALILYIVFKVGGSCESTLEFKRWPDLKENHYAEATRLALLVDACCRFLNTSGSTEELSEAFSAFEGLMRHAGVGSLAFPGFELLSTRLGGDPIYEHVFGNKETDEVIEWVEGEYVDWTDAPEMMGRLAEENEEETEESAEEETLFRQEDLGAEDNSPRRLGFSILPGGPGGRDV